MVEFKTQNVFLPTQSMFGIAFRAVTVMLNNADRGKFGRKCDTIIIKF